jgi:TPP-dependent pyruvate/acetoin dehydrogenase alpha subunit
MKVTVDGDILRRLYSRMLKCRMAARHAPKFHGGVAGQEAAIAGATIDLSPDDAVAPSRDEVALQLAIGTPPARAFAAGADGVTSDATSLHVLPTEAIASSQLGIAAGAALAYKLQKSAHVVVALTDNASLDFGSSHEALNFASAHKLPLVVVVECETPANPESSPDLMPKAAAYGIPGIAVDGNDAVAVYRVSREAIHRARSGRGPSLIECRAIDSQTDPVAHVERYLEKHGWWTAEWKRELTNRFRREIADAVRAAEIRK